MGFEPDGDRPLAMEAVHLSLPASHRYLNVLQAAIAALLEHAGPPPDRQKLSRIQLAAHELCANIVNHAYGGGGQGQRIDVAIGITAEPIAVILETQDSGSGFDPQAVPVPQTGAVQEGGYGLYLTRQAVDEVVYSSSAGRAWQSRGNEPWKAVPVPVASRLFTTIPDSVNFWRLVKAL